MPVDYDAPHRRTDEEEEVDGLEELKAASAVRSAQHPDVDQDEAEVADSFELPGADLSGESLAVRVEPKQSDEFACTRCFLVHHRSQLVDADAMVCRDCA
jgi:Domain of unknown function (DUF4193)